MTSPSFQVIQSAAFESAVSIQGLQLDFETFCSYLKQCDPTMKGKYQRWLFESLYKQIDSHPFDLDFSDSAAEAFKTLALFDDKKRYLPVELRSILSYQSLKEIRQVVAEHAWSINHLSPRLMDLTDAMEIVDQTRLYESQGLSVHKPRNIEDVAILFGNEEWLDSHGSGGFKRVKSMGDVYVILGDTGALLAVKPTTQGERGYVIDNCLEPGMFEDALLTHPLSYEHDREILNLLCEIDPALPFDLELEEVGPYVAALNQFPLVLHEDRTPSDEVLEALLAITELTADARTELEAL